MLIKSSSIIKKMNKNIIEVIHLMKEGIQKKINNTRKIIQKKINTINDIIFHMWEMHFQNLLIKYYY